MSFTHHKEVFLVITAVMIVVVALPFVQQALVSRKSEPNSEMWLLGQQHTADNYPFSIKPNQNYTVFLDVKNNLGDSSQYMVQVLFLNQTRQADTSSFASVYSSTAVVENGATWALPISFSIDFVYDDTSLKINLNNIRINNVIVDAKGTSIARDPETGGHFGYLYFELWEYDSGSSEFQDHGRSVYLRLNLAAS